MEATLRIESLVHGGDGLARLDGRAVFVPGCAPGDLVRLTVGEGHAGVLRGRIEEVVEPGPERVVPPCPIAGRCGGCPWQQVSDEAQRRAKEDSVRDALRRIGGFAELPQVRPIVPSPLQWRYRRRVRARPVGDGWGFAPQGETRVLRAPGCLLLEEEIERLADALAPALKKISLPGGVRSFVVDSDGRGGAAAWLELAQTPGLAVRARAAKLLTLVPGLRGLALEGGGEKAAVGDPVLVDRDHFGMRVRPDLFAQANRRGARLLAEAVAQTVPAGASVLELFAGSGTLTLPLAARAGRLVATEGEGPALDLLRLALSEAGREARLVAGPARRVAEGLAASGERFDQVVLDPPRAGAKDLMPALGRLGARRLAYVSCDPATFARDAGRLREGGWRLAEVRPFDLFPQTFHVELLAVFERN